LIQFENNVGVVHFEERTHAGQPGKFLHVLHDLYTITSSIDTTISAPFDPKLVFTRHDAVLAALAGAKLDEKPPDIPAAGGTPQ